MSQKQANDAGKTKTTRKVKRDKRRLIDGMFYTASSRFTSRIGADARAVLDEIAELLVRRYGVAVETIARDVGANYSVRRQGKPVVQLLIRDVGFARAVGDCAKSHVALAAVKPTPAAA